MGDNGEYRHLVDAGLGGVSSVVSSLPAGYTLGETRVVDGIKYRLVYNNSSDAQISVGQAASVVGSAGPYSVSVSFASKSNAHIGACIVKHSTLTTGTYGWGVVHGRVGGLDLNQAIATSFAAYLSGAGELSLMPGSAVTGNLAVAINLGGSAAATGVTASISGDFLVTLPDV